MSRFPFVSLIKLVDKMHEKPVGAALCIALLCVLTLGTVVAAMIIRHY